MFQKGRGSMNRSRNDNNKKDGQNQVFLVGTAKQASDFVKVKKACINTFKMKYKQGIYIATALEEGKEYDFTEERPKQLILVAETGTQEEILEAQGKNESSKIEYKMGMEKYNEKLETYQENKFKVYGYLWDKCSPQMKQNIESKSVFHSKIKDNPFELMKAIESLSCNYQESKYEVGIIYDAIKTFITLRQKEEESLTSYLERFKVASDNMKTQLGSELKLTKYTVQMDGYDKTQHEAFSIKGF